METTIRHYADRSARTFGISHISAFRMPSLHGDGPFFSITYKMEADEE